MTSINFNNGIYDFSTNTFNKNIETTDKKYDLSVNYDYKEYIGNEHIFNEINEYFNKLIKNEDERNRLLKFLSNTIKGINNNTINFIYGPASNGKSVYTLLIKQLLGDYYQSLDVSCIDELEINIKDIHKKFIIAMSEPESCIKIEDFLKKLQKSINKEDDATSKFQFLIICNMLPDFSNCPEQEQKRINIFHFNTTFISKDKKITKDYEEYIDFSYEQKVKENEWASALMWMLIHKY